MKIFKWIGIYAVCAVVHDAVQYAWEPIDAYIHKKVRKKLESIGCSTEKERNKSYSISDRKAGEPVGKIGF